MFRRILYHAYGLNYNCKITYLQYNNMFPNILLSSINFQHQSCAQRLWRRCVIVHFDLNKTPNDEAAHSSSEPEEVEDSDMEKFRKYLAQKLRIFDSDYSQQSQEKVLRELSLDGITEYIKENDTLKIITMAGAGISTSAGIPDFRSPSSGLYHNLEKYNLPHPQAIFELDFFMENPEPFFMLARELLPEGFKPTPSHYFIRLLWEKGLLLRHYTQNIDTLERMAGLPPEKLVEAHGTFHTGRCLKCRAPYTFVWMKEKIIEGVIPKCEECNEGVVKPDIVFFGEMLPERFHHLIDRDFTQADLLIIMGSSLVVQPFASLVDRVRPNCPRLLINKEKVGMQDRLSRLLGLRHGLVFDTRSSHGGRDVAWLGECDTGCQLLAEKLGWGDELTNLIKKEHERLDAENTNKD
ncbi:NAD-dependent protein deacetylase sirtuin-2 isoform X1 [Hylaeus volcanicus]|uniref:NAD-dependent protein deacetylase sirtuin-2 isoform X1 n=1 Tax=Hylaeus volcanicus TaxID=313075 RepID=UPI0023B7FA73|nr:NAD-dependent protein deacetylase sirtuin-2 isoform X1 [Hylaeus volcanicus]